MPAVVRAGLTAGNFSTPGGSWNTVDTVENVFIQNPAAGSWTVEVIGDEIVQDAHVETAALDADFALVISGGLLGRHLGRGVLRQRLDILSILNVKSRGQSTAFELTAARARRPNLQEDVMRKMTLLTVVVCTVLALSFSVPGTQAVEDPLPTTTTTALMQELDFEFPLGVTASLLRATPTCDASASLVTDSLRYECPFGVPYCWRAQDCAGYCGPGGFEVCQFGCCACAG